MLVLSRQTYANLAAVVFGAAAIHQFVNILMTEPNLPLVAAASRAIAAVDFLLYGGAAITLLLRKRSGTFTTASWMLGIFGVLGLLMKSLLLAPFGAPALAIVYGVGAALTAFLFKRAFDRGLLRHGRHLDPRLV